MNARETFFTFDGRFSLSSDEVLRLATVVRAATACRRRLEIAPGDKHMIVLSVVVPAPKKLRAAALRSSGGEE